MPSDTITVGLDIDGYDVDVVIQAGRIEREIQKYENEKPGFVSRHGLPNRDLSRLASVVAEPTDDKWDDLARAEVAADAE